MIKQTKVKQKLLKMKTLKGLHLTKLPAKTALVGLLVFVLVIGLAAPFARADRFDNEISQLEQQNEHSHDEVNALEIRANSLEDAINKLQKRINQLQEQITLNQAKSTQLKEDIRQAEAELERQKNTLGQSIKAMYLEGDISTLEMLATSNDLSDFVDKQQYREVVKDKIKAQVDAVTALRLKLKSQREKVEALIKEDIYYSTDGARHADVKSVQSIYTLRARAEPQSVEDCVAVMVTSNSNLVRTVHQFGKDKPSTERVAAMVTDFSLANIAWLKAPLGNPSLPEFEVMSACYAALEPTIPLWNKYLAEIERLRQLGRISADDHQLLRFESTAQLELMDMTQGSEGYLNGETISDVLDAVKAKLTAAKQVEVDAAKQTAQDVRKILVRQNALLRLKAETFAAITITVIRILLAIFFASVAVIGACYDLPDLSIFGTIFVLLGIAFSVFSAWNGQSIQTLTEPYREKLTSWRFLKLKALTSAPDEIPGTITPISGE